MRVVTGNDLSTLLRDLTQQDANKLLDVLSSGIVAYSRERGQNGKVDKLIHQPARIVFQTIDQDTTLVMPVSDTQQTGVKVVTVPHTGNIQGAVTLYSPKGQLQGVLNAAEITGFRTALAVMTLLVRWRAPPSPKLLVFGAGKQVEWHLRLALLLIPGITHVTVVNRGKKRLQELENDVLETALKPRYPHVEFQTIAKEDNQGYEMAMKTRLAEADIICCCTPSKEPLFAAKDLQGRGTTASGSGLDPSRRRFLSLIGSYTPEMQEIDTETLQMARGAAGGRIYVDSKEACLSECGELIRAGYGHDDLIEVGELFEDQGHRLNQTAALTIFKVVGFGLMDLVVARALLEMADGKQIGLVVQDF